jgi:hypothetical protein
VPRPHLARKLKASALMLGGALPAAAYLANAGPAAAITWQNKETGKYLQIVGRNTSMGARTNVAIKYSSDPNQHWDAVSMGYTSFSNVGAEDQWAFVNTNSDLCLSEHWKNTGEHVVQWSCGFDSYPQSDRWAEITSIGGGWPKGYYALGNFGRGWLACVGASDYVVQGPLLGEIENSPSAYSDCMWH